MPIRFEGLASEPIRSVTIDGEEVPCIVMPQESDSNNFASLNTTGSNTVSANNVKRKQRDDDDD